MNPLSTSRNKYYENEKNSSIMTPPFVAEFLFDLVSGILKEKSPYFLPSVLDPCCGTGNLLHPFKEYDFNWITVGVDLQDETMEGNIDTFYKSNFLSMELKDFEIDGNDPDFDLVICNPPFNNNDDNKKWMKENKKGKGLLPELFTDKIFNLFGKDVPLILFAPMGMRLNQRVKSNRWRKMREEYPQITSIISLPLDIFPGVEFHNEILIFNIPELEAHYYIPRDYLK